MCRHQFIKVSFTFTSKMNGCKSSSQIGWKIALFTHPAKTNYPFPVAKILIFPDCVTKPFRQYLCVMKQPILIAALSLGFSFANAQALEGKTTYKGKDQRAAFVEYPYKASIVKEAIRIYMEKAGGSAGSSKGFTVYKNASTNGESGDLYFKLDEKGKGDNVRTSVFLVPEKAGDDPEVAPQADDDHIAKAKQLLDDITPTIQRTNAINDVSVQGDLIAKTQKKLDQLSKDSISLVRKMKDLQADMDDNKADQQRQANILQSNVQNDEEASKKAHKSLDKLMSRQTKLQRQFKNAQEDLNKNVSDHANMVTTLQQQRDALDALKQKQ